MKLILIISILYALPVAAEDSALKYRNIFYSLAKGEYSEDQISKFILLEPDSTRGIRPVGPTAEDSLRLAKDLLKSLSPDQMYLTGKKYPVDKQNIPAKPSFNEPLTLILFPGFFGELTKYLPFDDLLHQGNSSFSRKFQSILEERNPHQDRDLAFSLDSMSDVEYNIEDLIEVGSIDDDEGQPIIQVIFLKPPFLSLESLSPMSHHLKYYKRRLDKIWSLFGGFQNLYFSSYSMGVNTALGLISEADKASIKPPWYDALNGVVSFSGSIWGTDVADAILYGHNTPLQHFTNFLDVLDSLQEGESWFVRKHNRKKLLKATYELSQLMLKAKNSIAHEPYQGLIGDLGEAFRIFSGLSKQTHFMGSIYSNRSFVQRIKLFSLHFRAALKDLSSQGRVQWFANHTLPSHLKYYAFRSTMAGKITSQNNIASSHLLHNPIYKFQNFDYFGMRAMYYASHEVENMDFSDSMINGFQGSFFPELHMQLNPRQEYYLSENLAVFSTHHLGAVYQNNLSTYPSEAHRFPFYLILKSLAYYLAED